MTTISQLMTSKVVTVGLDDSLKIVKEIFDHVHFHHLLVIEHGKLFGVISDRDLFKALSPALGTKFETPKDTATLNKKVHQIVTRKPITLMPHATMKDAIRIFNQHPISCIPIVNEHNEAVGILSWRDIFKYFYRNLK